MRESKPLNIFFILVVVGACAGAWLCFSGFPPSVESKLHTSIGAALAEQTLRVYKPGAQIIVLTRETRSFKQPEMDLAVKSFQKALARGHATITAVKAMEVDTLRPTEVPPGDFFDLLRKSPAGTLIVSFMGPPMLTSEQRQQLGKSKCSVVAFCPGGIAQYPNLKASFEDDLLTAAVLNRPNSNIPQSSEKGRTFDQLYLTVTSANLSSLPTVEAAQL
jgi:hypothetical protein